MAMWPDGSKVILCGRNAGQKASFVSFDTSTYLPVDQYASFVGYGSANAVHYINNSHFILDINTRNLSSPPFA